MKAHMDVREGESDRGEHGRLARHCRASVRTPGALRRAGGAAKRRSDRAVIRNTSSGSANPKPACLLQSQVTGSLLGQTFVCQKTAGMTATRAFGTLPRAAPDRCHMTRPRTHASHPAGTNVASAAHVFCRQIGLYTRRPVTARPTTPPWRCPRTTSHTGGNMES